MKGIPGDWPRRPEPVGASGAIPNASVARTTSPARKVAVIASDGDGYARFEVPVSVSPGSAAAKAKQAQEQKQIAAAS